MNPGILKALLNIKVKGISYTSKSFLNTSKSSTENAYKSYKNRLTHSRRVAKCFYCENIFRALNRDISNPGEIANLFCKYFTDIGPN